MIVFAVSIQLSAALGDKNALNALTIPKQPLHSCMITLDQIVPRLFVDVQIAFEMWIKDGSIARELTCIRSIRKRCFVHMSQVCTGLLSQAPRMTQKVGCKRHILTNQLSADLTIYEGLQTSATSIESAKLFGDWGES
ncbi:MULTISPECIES: hypothetical protein [unclassified Ruegeria]|uniref:hypothetical protein n=1 Tax=unclassified Ruegeria TaxID=2625375 RepID=UPI001489631D|nr:MULTISPECIES: hypothetical protein [unclassified Ruegeria]